MSRWVVKEEFVPIEGARIPPDDELAAIAARVREQFEEQEGAANGRGGRFIVSAKIDAASAAEAEAWGRRTLYDKVTDLLDGWRLDEITSWPA